MIYGKIATPLLALTLGVLFATFGVATARAATVPDSGWITVKLVAIRADSIQLREQGGELVMAALTPTSLLLSKGTPTLSLKEFRPGESVCVRLRPETREGARPRIETLSDSETKAALDSIDKRSVAGSVRAELPGWLVIRTDSSDSLPVELTSATLYRRMGNVTPDCPFVLGDRVLVEIHASATGSLLASSVSDEETSEQPETALPITVEKIVHGSIVAVRSSSHALTVMTTQGAQIAVSAPTNITSIRISRHKETLSDLRTGMKVVVHLTGGADSSGYVARTISATP